MKYFFTAFYKSLYDSAWLKAVRVFPGKAWSYFCLLVFVFSLIAVVPTGLAFRSFSQEFGQNFSASAPSFQANLKSGKLTIEKLKQPFVYHLSDFTLVIDTKSTSSVEIEKFVTSTAGSTLLITSDRAEFHDAKTGESRAQTWSGMPDYSFSKGDVEAGLHQLATPWYLALSMLVIFTGLYLGFFVVKLYNILLVTLMVSVFARLSGRMMKFWELFTIGLYAITLPSIIGIALALTGLEFSYVQFLALLAFMLAMVWSDDGTDKLNGRVV